MERKTKINAEDGKQELVITREFDLPLELLFKAYVEPEIVEQWMTSKVVKLESKKNGSYQLKKRKFVEIRPLQAILFYVTTFRQIQFYTDICRLTLPEGRPLPKKLEVVRIS